MSYNSVHPGAGQIIALNMFERTVGGETKVVFWFKFSRYFIYIYIYTYLFNMHDIKDIFINVK